MKKIILVIFIFAQFLKVFGQGSDIIIKKDNTVIKGKILRQSEDIEIDPEGSIPFILIKKNDLKMVILSNGTTIDYEKKNDDTNLNSPDANKISGLYLYENNKYVDTKNTFELYKEKVVESLLDCNFSDVVEKDFYDHKGLDYIKYTMKIEIKFNSKSKLFSKYLTISDLTFIIGIFDAEGNSLFRKRYSNEKFQTDYVYSIGVSVGTKDPKFWNNGVEGKVFSYEPFNFKNVEFVPELQFIPLQVNSQHNLTTTSTKNIFNYTFNFQLNYK
jgi:hypothetical protein